MHQLYLTIYIYIQLFNYHVLWMFCGCVELCPMSNTRDGANMDGTMPLPRLTAERLTHLGSISANAEKTPTRPQWEPMGIISLKGFLYRANVCIKY